MPTCSRRIRVSICGAMTWVTGGVALASGTTIPKGDAEACPIGWETEGDRCLSSTRKSVLPRAYLGRCPYGWQVHESVCFTDGEMRVIPMMSGTCPVDWKPHRTSCYSSYSSSVDRPPDSQAKQESDTGKSDHHGGLTVGSSREDAFLATVHVGRILNMPESSNTVWVGPPPIFIEASLTSFPKQSKRPSIGFDALWRKTFRGSASPGYEFGGGLRVGGVSANGYPLPYVFGHATLSKHEELSNPQAGCSPSDVGNFCLIGSDSSAVGFTLGAGLSLPIYKTGVFLDVKTSYFVEALGDHNFSPWCGSVGLGLRE